MNETSQGMGITAPNGGQREVEEGVATRRRGVDEWEGWEGAK